MDKIIADLPDVFAFSYTENLRDYGWDEGFLSVTKERFSVTKPSPLVVILDVGRTLVNSTFQNFIGC